jgi:hypothetical protein
MLISTRKIESRLLAKAYTVPAYRHLQEIYDMTLLPRSLTVFALIFSTHGATSAMKDL